MTKGYSDRIKELMDRDRSDKVSVTTIIKELGHPPCGRKFGRYISDCATLYLGYSGSTVCRRYPVWEGQAVSTAVLAAVSAILAAPNPPPPTLPLSSSIGNSSKAYLLVKTKDQVSQSLSVLKDQAVDCWVALDMSFDVESRADDHPDLILLKIAYSKPDGSSNALLYNVKEIGVDCLKETLEWVCSTTTVLVHDGRMEALYLSRQFNIRFTPSSIVDSQIVCEVLRGDDQFATLNTFLGLAGLTHPLKDTLQANGDASTWISRPFTDRILEYAADDVVLLLNAFNIVAGKHIDPDIDFWIDASYHSLRSVNPNTMFGKECVFDTKTWKKVTRGVWMVNSSDQDDDAVLETGIEKVSVELDVSDLERILPRNLFTRITALDLKYARDVVLDVNKRPRMFSRNKKVTFLFDNDSDDADADKHTTFTRPELDEMVANLSIGHDNRAILDGSLHRISCIRNTNGSVYGITLRFGRTITGISTVFNDYLHSDKSILILGPPGSGKSSVIRDCIRVLAAEPQHVIVVDTSNEICGNGDEIHKSLGNARRMMVPNLAAQTSVMIEAVQNHTPDLIVIDEIGRQPEVLAASTIKQRGVRLVATCHGHSLRDLMKNPSLKGLLGGFEQIILSDSQAKMGKSGTLEKLQTKRAGMPVFDTIIQLEKDAVDHDQVKIIPNVAEAVDALLEGRDVLYEVRRMGGLYEMYVSLGKL